MLAASQNSFYQAICKNDYSGLSLFSSGLHAERLAIYKASITENLRNSLSLYYPGIWKLLGKACADNLAWAFCSTRANFPTTGYLDEWGERFPDFLSEQKELKDLPYLQDFARYEWLKHRAYCAEPVVTIKAPDLKICLDQDLDNMRFSLIPSMFLLSADFPLEQIQAITENKNAAAIDLYKTKIYCVIARPDEEVQVFWINRALYSFFQALKGNMSLKNALTIVQVEFIDFDLTAAFIFLLANKLLY